MKGVKIAALVLLGGLSVSGARAQDDLYLPGTSPLDHAQMQLNTSLTHINNLTLQKIVERNAAKRGKSGGAATRKPVSTNASFSYTPSAALKDKTVQQFQARLAKANPDAAKAVGTQFRKYDYDSIYKGLISGTGLRNNDAADALAAYMLLNYMIANNITSDLSPAQGRALRAQVASLMASTPAARSTSLRAQTAEEMKLLTVIAHAGWQSSRKAGSLKTYRDQIASSFRQQFGLDLRAVKLTNAGFQWRS